MKGWKSPTLTMVPEVFDLESEGDVYKRTFKVVEDFKDVLTLFKVNHDLHFTQVTGLRVVHLA